MTYKTFTSNETNSSPSRQFQIDTITDPYGNVATFTYASQQQGGLWVVSEINVNSGETVLKYEYDPTTEMLASVSVLVDDSNPSNPIFDILSNYTYGTDPTYSLPTIGWDERVPEAEGACECPLGTDSRGDTILLSADYQIPDDPDLPFIINQYSHILHGRKNGSNQVKTLIYRHETNYGWYRILDQGTMCEVKLGESIQYCTSFTDAGPGYGGTVPPVMETTYLHGVDQSDNPLTTYQIINNIPPRIIDETGYARNYTYGGKNVETIEYPGDPTTTEKFWYDGNNRVKTYKDRANLATFIVRSTNANNPLLNDRVIQVVCGDVTSTDGTLYVPVSTGNADKIQKIFGYHDQGPNEGLLKWSAVTLFDDNQLGNVVEPSVNERLDYVYYGDNRLKMVLKPLPEGQSDRPATEYEWVGCRPSKTTTGAFNGTNIVDPKVVEFAYDPYMRLISTLYGDGTTQQSYYDDVGLMIYQKNRLGVVSRTELASSGRVSIHKDAYGRTADLSQGVVDIINDNTIVESTTYLYTAGHSQPIIIDRNRARRYFSRDYRNRVKSEWGYPRKNRMISTSREYENNLLFKTTQKTIDMTSGPFPGTTLFETNTYFGHSANRLTVRKITVRDPGITFNDNDDVIIEPYPETDSPDIHIVDAIRDVRGTIICTIDPYGVETVITPDALGRTVTRTRQEAPLSLDETFVYDAHGNIVESVSETGLETHQEFDPADNVKKRTIGRGTSWMETAYTYTTDSKIKTMVVPREVNDTPTTATTTYIYETCCDHSSGIRNELNHGTIQNQDSEGRTTHTAVVQDFDDHTNLLDPIDNKTLSETTTQYDDLGRVKFRTVWAQPLTGTLDRNSPPIAGLGGFPSPQSGVTTQYVYDSVLYDQVGLDSAAGLEISRLFGAPSAFITIKPALDKLKLAIASGGAATELALGSAGSATVVISPDEKTLNVTILNAVGQQVMTALMTGPAWVGDANDPLPDNPNELIDWTCTQFEQQNATEYQSYEQVVSIDAFGKTTKSYFNGLGQRVVSIDQLDNRMFYIYDKGGNLKTESLGPESSQTVLRSYDYDELGRQIKVTDALGHENRTVFYKNIDPPIHRGLVKQRIDAKNQVTSFSYNDFDQIETTTDRLSQPTVRTYDAGGLLDTITDADSKTTEYAYDLLGQKVKTTFEDDGEFETEYDGAGRPTLMTADSGRTKTNFYEFSGVLDRIEYDDGVNVTTDNFSYDNFLRPTSSVSKDSVTRTLTYSERGSLKTDTTGYSNQNYVTEYEYDSRGRNTKIKYPSGRAVSYTFTDRSELDLVNWDSVNIEDRGYDALGRLDSVSRPNSVNESRAYDYANRLLEIENVSVGKATYSYDDNDNKLTETWTGPLAPYSFVTTPGSPTWDGRFTTGYDAEDRLRNFIQPSISTDMELVRNQIGVITDPKTSGTDNARTFSNTWELTSLTPTGPSQVYDSDGQLTTRHTGDVLTWDPPGRMTQAAVSNGNTGIVGTHNYGYDADGKRVWKKVNETGQSLVETVYIYAGPNCIAEYDAGANPATTQPKQEYVYAQGIDSLVMIVRNGGAQKLTVTRNQQWSISALLDGTSVVELYSYDVFGKRSIWEANGTTPRSTSNYNNPYGYTSRRHDYETGLMYFRARYYDPATNEFISKDPLEYVDGMSMYRGYFVPTGVDPLGLHAVDVFGNRIGPSRSRCDSEVDVAIELSAIGGSLKFSLSAQASSDDCCNLSTVGVSTYEHTTMNTTFDRHSTHYGYGVVKVSERIRGSRGYFRKDPELNSLCDDCPCEEGVECVERKYHYGAHSILGTRADGTISITVCADGSFTAWGFGTAYDSLLGDKDMEKTEFIHKQKTCPHL